MNQPEFEMEMPLGERGAEKQNMNVLPFTFKDAQIRTVSQGGNPWFVLSDVCDALGMSNPSMVAARLEFDEKQTITLSQTEGIRGNPNVTIINEPGLYSVILRSDKPEAKEFKRWVCHEVLPTIRKTGTYVTPSRGDVHLAKLATQFEGAVKLAKLLGLNGNQSLLSAANVVNKCFGVNPVQLFEIELKAPSQNRLMTPTQIGQELEALSGRKHSARMINETLRELGFQVKTAAGWEATETAKAEGIAVLQDTGKKHSSGVPVQQLKWDRSILEQLKGGLR